MTANKFGPKDDHRPGRRRTARWHGKCFPTRRQGFTREEWITLMNGGLICGIDFELEQLREQVQQLRVFVALLRENY
jgi:hypothetical protein